MSVVIVKWRASNKQNTRIEEVVEIAEGPAFLTVTFENGVRSAIRNDRIDEWVELPQALVDAQAEALAEEAAKADKPRLIKPTGEEVDEVVDTVEQPS